MYESFYGLASKPFQLSPDPNFYFGSKQHRRAKAYLDYGVLRNDGFIVITGEIGAGKTTLLRGLLDSLNRSNVVIGNLVTTQLDAEDTLRMVGAAFGVRVKDLPKSELLMSLEAHFVNQTTQGKRCLLIVDEAQNLSARAVEELRMLSNFQFGNQSLLQTFLVGQPEFRGILQKPEMEQFRQRVAATCHIGPLDEDETKAYIEHRLKCAGSTGKPTFDLDAFPAVFKASQGIPRRINSLCDRLLLLGFMSNRTHLTLVDVQEVLRDIAQESEVPKSSSFGALTNKAGNRAGNRAGNGAGNKAGTGAEDATEAGADGADGAPLVPLGQALDMSRLKLHAIDVDGLSSEISALSDSDHADRLHRLERSLLRLEHINAQTLTLLQKLVEAVKTN